MDSKNTAYATTPETARAVEEYLYNAGWKAAESRYTPQIFQADGKTYIAINGNYTRIENKPDHEITPDIFHAFSLDGLVDYIIADVDNHFNGDERCIVRVKDPTTVKIETPLRGYWKERFVIAECQAQVPYITFDSYMDPERFQIMLQADFLPSTNLDIVLKMAGSLSKEQNITMADDGVSQRVTLNTGVATKAVTTIKNPCALSPIRTFYEIQQVESQFVLRFNDNGECALFVGDGGAWQAEAVRRIVNYLKERLAGQNVVVIG